MRNEWTGLLSVALLATACASDSVTNTSPPAAPAALGAVARQQRIDLVWTNSSNEDGFRIERRPLSTFNWVQLTTLSANDTTYSDILGDWEQFCYRVLAFNASGESDWSPPACQTTFPTLLEAGDLYCPDGKELWAEYIIVSLIPIGVRSVCADKCPDGGYRVSPRDCMGASGVVFSEANEEHLGCYRPWQFPVNPSGPFEGCYTSLAFPYRGVPTGHLETTATNCPDGADCWNTVGLLGQYGYNCGQNRGGDRAINELDLACYMHDKACWSADPQSGDTHLENSAQWIAANWVGFARYLANIRTTDVALAKQQYVLVVFLHAYLHSPPLISGVHVRTDLPAWQFEQLYRGQEGRGVVSAMNCPAPTEYPFSWPSGWN